MGEDGDGDERCDEGSEVTGALSEGAVVFRRRASGSGALSNQSLSERRLPQILKRTIHAGQTV